MRTMTEKPPACVGTHLDDIETPALIVDLDTFDANIARMKEIMRDYPQIAVRPHAKTHKCSAIAQIQMEAGAAGMCCQTVVEAEAMVAGGIMDVVITNQLVTPGKLARAAQLAKKARIEICVDDAANIAALADAAGKAGSRLDVRVEIEVGNSRAGVEPGAAAADLAAAVAAQETLRFTGLQAYCGSAQHHTALADREAACRAVVDRVTATTAAIAEKGLSCNVVAGGGTGTFALDAGLGVLNELQPGSYVFMDAQYAGNLDADDRPVADFGHSLFVLATVISAARHGKAVADAGLKAISIDKGMPRIHGDADAEPVRISDEHIVFDKPGHIFRIGEKLHLVPPHCDPTVNLHDWLIGMRGDRVETVWAVDGRGGTA